MKNWCNRNGMPVFGGLIGPGYTQNPTGNESAQFLYRKMSAVQRDEPLMLTHLANLPRGTARTVTSRWVRGSITSRMDQIDQSIAELYTLI